MLNTLTDLPRRPCRNPSTHDNPSAGILQTKQPSVVKSEFIAFLRGKNPHPLPARLIERGMALPNEVVGGQGR